MKFKDIEKGGFPDTYLVVGSTSAEAMQSVLKELIAEPVKVTVNRVLEDEEIAAIRDEYTALYENDRIECEKRIATLNAEKLSIEARMKEERDVLASIMQRINDSVRTINDGYTCDTFDKDTAFRAYVDGHYLTYVYEDSDAHSLEDIGIDDVVVRSTFRLAKVEECKPDGSLFTCQTVNNEAFITTYGANFNNLGHFTEIDTVDKSAVRSLIGKKLAVAVETAYAIIARDTVLTDEEAGWIVKDEDVRKVIVYAETHE